MIIWSDWGTIIFYMATMKNFWFHRITTGKIYAKIQIEMHK